jgi:hypothetical protein
VITKNCKTISRSIIKFCDKFEKPEEIIKSILGFFLDKPLYFYQDVWGNIKESRLWEQAYAMKEIEF